MHSLKFGDQQFQVLDLCDMLDQSLPKKVNFGGVLRGVGGGKERRHEQSLREPRHCEQPYLQGLSD